MEGRRRAGYRLQLCAHGYLSGGQGRRPAAGVAGASAAHRPRGVHLRPDQRGNRPPSVRDPAGLFPGDEGIRRDGIQSHRHHRAAGGPQPRLRGGSVENPEQSGGGSAAERRGKRPGLRGAAGAARRAGGIHAGLYRHGQRWGGGLGRQDHPADLQHHHRLSEAGGDAAQPGGADRRVSTRRWRSMWKPISAGSPCGWERGASAP